MYVPYEMIGRIAVYFSLASLVVFVLALGIGVYSFRSKNIIFPNFVLFVLDFFYAPAKWVCRVFSVKNTLVDEIMIEIRNAILLEKFSNVRDGKLFIGPQCMRHPECKARCDPRIGYVCTGCGKCDYARLKKECETYGYQMFIVPGDSFVKKIIKMYRPKAALGVACFGELNESMHDLSPFIAVQGVALLRDGCFNTAVNVEEVIEKMKMGVS